MASSNIKLKHKTEKAVFELRFNPKLDFFDKLFEENVFQSEFEKWFTDRLKITFSDTKKKHSLLINHEKIVYEIDSFDKAIEKEYIDKIIKSYNLFFKNEDLNRIGHRFWILIPIKEMSFEDLNELFNIKVYSEGLLTSLGDNPIDNLVSIRSKAGDLHYKLDFAPISKIQIPEFIKLNIQSHISQDRFESVKEVNRIYDEYPEVALYLDLDISIEIDDIRKLENNISKFYNDSIELREKINSDILNHFFKA